jgi:Tfp pilus assembly protein PilN
MVKVIRPGIALSATGVCIARPGATRPAVTRIPLGATPGDNGSWPELAEALRGAAAGGEAGDLAVALLPPLVEVRRLALPPLAEGDLLQLLARNAARYFVGARGTQTIGARQWRGERGQPAPVLAAAAPTRFVGAVHGAARDAGWTVTSVTPAEGAWAAAAVAMWPSFGKGTAHVLVHEDDRIVLVELERGEVSNVRRFRGGAADAVMIATAIIEAQGGSATAVGAIGLPAGRQELVRALGARSVPVSPIPADWAEYADAAEVVAAIAAGISAGPVLASESVRAEWKQRAQRATLMVAGVAALFFVLAAAFELWGVHRELAAVQAQRAAIRPQVSATLIGRSSLEDAYKRLATIAEAQRTAPRWAPILAELTRRLPEDAYFTTVRTRGDSLVVDGMAASASKVFTAIDASPSLKGVRAPAPVRRQSQEGGDPMERFTLAASLPGAATAPAAPVMKKPITAGGKAP